MSVSKVNKNNEAAVAAAAKAAKHAKQAKGDVSFKDALKLAKPEKDAPKLAKPEKDAPKLATRDQDPKPQALAERDAKSVEIGALDEGKSDALKLRRAEAEDSGIAGLKPAPEDKPDDVGEFALEPKMEDETPLGGDPDRDPTLDPSMTPMDSPMNPQGTPVVANTPAPAAAPPTEVVQQLVNAMAAEGWVGTDIHGRKIVMMNVKCPGRGNVKIRLRQEEAGVSVRVRADNDDLAKLLDQNQDVLKDSMKQKGMSLAGLEVVT